MLKINNKEVLVKGVSVKQALDSPLFTNWKRSVGPDVIVSSIEFQSVDEVGRGDHRRILFIKMKVEASDLDGNSIPGIVFLRGDCVCILPILSAPTGEYVLLVKQTRLATGGVMREIPAGMIDQDETPIEAAKRELEEETGIAVLDHELVSLVGASENPSPCYLSPGCSDERAYFFSFRREVTELELSSLKDQVRGLESERERIVLEIVSVEELLKSSVDFKAKMAYLLFGQKTNGGFHD